MSAVLFIAIPLLAAFLSILSKKVAPYLMLIVSAALVVLLTVVPQETILIGGYQSPWGIVLVLDQYSQIALYVTNIAFFLIAAMNFCDYKKMGTILLVALAGLNGLLLTGDLFNLFVFLEIAGISAYLISSTNKKPLHTFHYLVAGTVGSSLYLLGLIILYNMFGTLNMADMADALVGVNPVLVAFPFLLMFIGLGVEAKLVPFNAWVKGILGHANTLSGPMIAGVYAGASLFVFGRLLTSVFVLSDQLMLIVSVVVGFSILAGEAMAYASTKARQVLLFSSIAQAGIAVLMFVYGFALIGVLFVTLNVFSKLVLFTVIAQMSAQTGSDEIADLRGVFAANKWVGAGFSAVVLSVLGLPLFAGFLVKLSILEALFAADNLLFPAIILLSSVVEGVYFIKMLVSFWYSKKEAPKLSFTKLQVYVILVIAGILVVFGSYVQLYFDVIASIGGGI
ncbi:complex I subunit 5 family protein [Candidatus Xianfuyuplasma coldseepsis]|uniref:NADH-ubiquinone oxidoreductase n=1 Tax=Candidatus Xianfuyuplasma coldseepsis TaxID=2782163 RepID=A0A7L7KUJ0_9MOLU|nr:proton-conducting transporter membrane subunit [Xianfuyuplasma coldseepsis]QMS85952.1 NADH-ubiquinone oxidoreductase [Xianfuyuplasma coldseepsis]